MKYVLWLAALAACGSSPSPASPDAASPDAPTAATGPVTVSAYQPGAGSPIPGATVLFYDLAGNLVDRQVTDTSGLATGMVPSGGSVTVIPPASAMQTYYTWTGVAPGDHLFTAEPAAAPVPGDHDVSITIPRDGNDVTAYSVTGPGFSAVTSAPPASGNIVLTGTVHGGSPSVGDLVGDALHADHTHHFFVVHLASLDVPVLDLSSAFWRGPTNIERTITGLPDDTSGIAAYNQLLTGSSVVWQGSMQWQNWSLPTLVFDGDAPEGSSGLQLFWQRGEPNPQYRSLSYNQPPATIDLAKLAPTAFNITRQDHTVSWDVAGDPSTGAMAVRLDFRGPVATWSVVMPASQRSFIPPQIPADLPGPQSLYTPEVTFVGGNDPAGYAAARTDPHIFDLYHYAQVMPSVPGVYRFSGR